MKSFALSVTVIALFLTAITRCYGKTVIIEAESAQGAHAIHHRDHASGLKTVWLKRNEFITHSFCLIRKTTFSLKNVFFSNDGGSDICSVSIDGAFLGDFKSTSGSKYGQLWNVFEPSGSVGPSFELEGGWNIITINVTSADDYGIEIDRIEFSVSDDELSEDIFTCMLTCSKDLPFVTTSGFSSIKPGTAVQKSYKTQCVEEDNVNIPIFNADVKEFEISASLPQYRSFLNLRDKNTHNCPFITPIYWQYEDVIMSSRLQNMMSNLSNLSLFQSMHPTNGGKTSITLIVHFQLKGHKYGYIDSEIGSTFSLTMKPLVFPVEVIISFEHRTRGLVILPPIKFTESKLSHSWNIPHFTWKEDDLNKIFVTTKAAIDVPEVSSMKLERRYMSTDQVTNIYSSDLIIVEAVRVDFWWQAPQTMQLVRPSTGETWDNIAYFRIYFSLPWTNGFSQVFVLYQDGNTRLLNPTPHGLDWTPFGTSVIIGQTNVNDFRPSVSITRVEIEPEERMMKLAYADGSSVALTLIPSFTRTLLYVSDVNFKKDTSVHPFATFRSNYVNAGNCDADSLMSDTENTKQILGETWKEMNGTSFLIFRRCESKHLTQSPDIKLEITKT